MKRGLNLTALQTALLIGLGNAMISGGCLLVAFIPSAHHRTHFPWTPIVVSLALMVLGFVLTLKYESVLKKGALSGRWEPNQIEPIRNAVESVLWKAVGFGVGVVGCAALMIDWPHGSTLAWVFLFPSMTAMRLSLSLKEPRDPKLLIDWHSFGPLRSDRWGQR